MESLYLYNRTHRRRPCTGTRRLIYSSYPPGPCSPPYLGRIFRRSRSLLVHGSSLPLHRSKGLPLSHIIFLEPVSLILHPPSYSVSFPDPVDLSGTRDTGVSVAVVVRPTTIKGLGGTGTLLYAVHYLDETTINKGRVCPSAI